MEVKKSKKQTSFPNVVRDHDIFNLNIKSDNVSSIKSYKVECEKSIDKLMKVNKYNHNSHKILKYFIH